VTSIRERLEAAHRGHVQVEAATQHHEYVAIADRIARDPAETVLDWGSGVGQVSDLLRRRGLAVSSFEYRPELEAPSEERSPLIPEITAQVSPEPVALPYEDDAFDAVLSCGVLEHVEDPDANLEEIRRVLRPGGTFYVYKLPNRFSYTEFLARRLGLAHHGSRPFDRLYDKRRARALMGRHGFEITEMRRANMLPLALRGRFLERHSRGWWRANRALARVPLLNLLATNLELVATRAQ
jgi:SAM-dependent methyltransferase